MTEINSLIQLQDVDSQLMDLEELQGDLPSKVEDLSSRLEELNASIHSAKARITEIDSEIRQLEGHESDRRTKVVKLKDQLYLVKTNREYDALMSEIDHLEEEIDTEENRELDLMQEKEQLEEQLKFDESQISELDIELKIQAGELEKRVASSKEEETRLSQEREKIVPRCPNNPFAEDSCACLLYWKMPNIEDMHNKIAEERQKIVAANWDMAVSRRKIAAITSEIQNKIILQEKARKNQKQNLQ